MSAYYEDAIEAAVGAFEEATGTSVDELPSEWSDEAIVRWVIRGFLAALPPSIIVDGKVVGLDDERVLAVIRDEFGDHGVAAVKWLTQAVLEVAE